MRRPVGTVLWCVLAGACATRELPTREPDYGDVSPIIERACLPCHDGSTGEAGWSAGSYVDVIGCPADSGPAVEPGDERAPLLAVLGADEAHAGLLASEEVALLRAWVLRGAPDDAGAVHPIGWTDPRSGVFHGAELRREGHYFGERTLEEIGAEMGISKSWASRLCTRALGKMRAALLLTDAWP